MGDRVSLVVLLVMSIFSGMISSSLCRVLRRGRLWCREILF